ncbi:MAG TPA: hypothetical protein VF272_02455 [Candidatus Saccharimonadia bacterium]
MALTATDLSNIKVSIADVVQPRFEELNLRFDETNSRLSQFRADFDNFAAATQRKFHTAFSDIAFTREDLQAVKEMVTDHGFRLARLEQKDGRRE